MQQNNVIFLKLAFILAAFAYFQPEGKMDQARIWQEDFHEAWVHWRPTITGAEESNSAFFWDGADPVSVQMEKSGQEVWPSTHNPSKL